jgi:hypothetical protein
MSSESKNGFFGKVRGVRDSAMEDLAKMTLAWTSSNVYQGMNASISKPVMLLAGISRKATRSVTAGALGRLNLPSREDVLALSQRLTRMEMVLDDVGAGMDQLRRPSSPGQRPRRADTRPAPMRIRRSPRSAKEG